MKKIFGLLTLFILLYTTTTHARIAPDCISVDSSRPCSVVPTGDPVTPVLPVDPIKPIEPEPILPAIANPTVTVLSPNGGDTYFVAQDSIGTTNWINYKVKITSQKAGTLYKYIVKNQNKNNLGQTLSFGSSNYLAPNAVVDSGGRFGNFPLTDGTYYFMAQWKSADGLENIMDFSDKSFTITTKKDPTIKDIKIIDPIIRDTDLPTDCTLATGYGITTGKPCGNNGVNPPIGCTASSLFSPVTGAPCSSWSYPVPVKSPLVVGSSSGNKYLFTRRLTKGMKGDDVVALQRKLTLEGVHSGTADGSFGPMTKGAVQRFQAKYGLGQDGAVGPMTLAKLNQ